MQKKWLAGFLDLESQKKLGKVMKLIIVILIGFMMTVSANSYSQKTRLDVNLSNTTIKGLFDYIEQNSEFIFLYRSEDFNTSKKVDIELRDATINQILDQALKSEKVVYDVYERQIVIRKANEPVNAEQPQKRAISGTVKDSKGISIPGVSVVVKGTTTGVITDMKGNFTLSVPIATKNLSFSFIGMRSQDIEITGKTTIMITMEDETVGIEEVVAVGYGTVKKSISTGAISSVKVSDLENQQISRLEQAMQGRTSGITITSSSGAPGAESTVRIRGATSLNEGASDPLYVVDGVVVDKSCIDYLNLSDIASLEVLKDGASAAIYGARSSAGVILVTTKKGKAGEGIRVNYNGYYGTQAPTKKLDLLNASQYAMLRNEQSINGGGKAIFANPESYGLGTDWQSVIFNNNALIQDHEVNISGGSDKSTFYTSFGYFDQDGIVATDISNYKRFSIRLNSTHKIKNWLTFGQTLAFAHIKSLVGVDNNNEKGDGPLSAAINLDPITKVLITDSNEAKAVPYSSQPVIRDAQGFPYGISEICRKSNPLAYNKIQEGNYNWSDNILGNVFVEAEPIKGLKLRSTLGMRFTYFGSEIFTPIYFLNGSTINTQTSFSRDKRQIFNWNLENTASYNHTFNKHDLTILLGQGAYLENNSSFLDVTYFNLPVTNFDDASMNYSTSTGNKLAEGGEGILHKVSSLFSRITYNYGEKYLFTGIIRRDGSSRFGSNNKFGYFPSASVGWVTSKEDFWPENKIVSFMKIRGSYGITGNDELGDFRYISTVGGGRNYTFGNNNYIIGYSPDAPPNSDLKWEETSQLNFGLDATLLQNWRLTLDWYKKKTVGILQVVDLPGYSGTTGSPWGNVADMENRGAELEIGYHKLIGEFNLDITGNVSYLQNEVTYLGEGKTFLEGTVTVANSSYTLTRTAIGQAIGSFYGFKTDGIFQKQSEIDAYIGSKGTKIQPAAKPGDFRWKDINNDGIITADDRTFIGDPTPNWSYGFTLNASWKNFDLLMFGQGIAGNQIFQGLRRLDYPEANWQTNALSRWTGEGTSNTYPRLTVSDINKNFANPSDFLLQKGDYFRIKTLQIGYSLPKSVIDKVGLSRTRIYISSNNLLTVSKYTGYDPEIGGSSYGIDRAIYPQPRSFILGVNVGF